MDPVTLTGISLAATALGGATSAFGALRKGEAQAGQYGYQAGVARLNADIQRQNAEYSLAAGESEAYRSGTASRYKIGQARVAQSGSGIDVNTGTNAELIGSMEDVAQHDQDMIRFGAKRKAQGQFLESEMSSEKARMLSKATEDAQNAGVLESIGSILGTAGSVSSRWMTASQHGVFSSGRDKPMPFYYEQEV